MSKYIYTYLLMTLFLFAVALPTYTSLFESECDAAWIMGDTDGDEGIKEFEVKIIFSYDNLIYSYLSTYQGRTLGYLVKVYTSFYKKLEPPPPEF